MQSTLRFECEPGVAENDNVLDVSFHTMSSTGADVEDFDTSHDADGSGASPYPLPRKLDFSHSSIDSSPEAMSSPVLSRYQSSEQHSFLHHNTDSPPYKRVKSLRLMDSPATPKTILEKSAAPLTPICGARNRLLPILDRSCFGVDKCKPRTLSTSSCSLPTSSDKLAVNLNPFTPNGMMLASKKRPRSYLNMSG